jgi:hypothetical protein
MRLQTRFKLETKMQKRSRNLDSYELEEKIREIDDQQLKLNIVQSRLWQN